MIKRIWNFLRLDMTLSFRDNLVVYSLVSPLALAVIVRLVVPSVQDATFTMAVHSAVDASVTERLREYGAVEVYESREQLLARVNRNDDVPGIYLEDGEYRIVMEGNEEAEAGEGFAAILRAATGSLDTVRFEIRTVQDEPVPVLGYAAAMMVMLSLFIGGIIVGFNIVDEKETAVIRAMAATPLRMLEYIAARSILALLIGCVTGFLSAAVILGWSADFGGLAIGMLVGLLVALPFGFIIGAFADNQMTAFALIKLLMAVFLTLPFVSLFVPEAWQKVFYIFPNYWMLVTIVNVTVGDAYTGFGLAAALTAVTGIAMIVLLLPGMRKGLRLR